jgi:Zn-dependent protease
MKTSFRLFNFVGAPVELSIWFFLIFLFLPSVSLVVSIFISVLIHEMAHALVAHRRGWHVSQIRIDLFTGSAHIDSNIHERDSIPVVAAGPLSNLTLAFLTTSLLAFTQVYILDVSPTIYKFLLDLISVNFILFIFNILPIYPLDGGRLVKDFLTLKLRSRLKAKKIAGTISLITSILVLYYSIVTTNIMLIVFSCLFIYMALKELKIIKD